MQNQLKKPRLSEEVRKGVKMLSTGLILILVLTGGLFLLNISTTSQNGYEFRQQELINEKLKSDNYILKQQVLEAGSLERIKENSSMQNKMRPAESVDFIESREERLTKR